MSLFTKTDNFNNFLTWHKDCLMDIRVQKIRIETK